MLRLGYEATRDSREDPGRDEASDVSLRIKKFSVLVSCAMSVREPSNGRSDVDGSDQAI